MTYKPNHPLTPAIPVIPVITGDCIPKEITKITGITGDANIGGSRGRSFFAAQVTAIKAAWRRIFGIDIEARRSAAGLPSVANHLRHMLDRPTPLADALLREIEANPLPLAAKLHRQTEKQRYIESKDPGITPGDVFRIFGNGARTVLTDEEIESVLGKNYRYTAPSRIAVPDKICRHCSKRKAFAPPWRRFGKIVLTTYPNGESEWRCSFCSRLWKPEKPKK